MMGAVRMLPSLGRTSANINIMSFYVTSLESAYNNMKILKEEELANEVLEVEEQKYKDEDEKGLTFNDSLCLSNIYWHYKDSEKNILSDLNLKVEKGQSVGLIGSSGAGKSTLADIILGLHIPNQGSVKLDGHDIRHIPQTYSRIIGFVPQSIYLLDGTIRENVAFGEGKENIDDNKIWNCLEKAQIGEFVRKLEDGLDTIVGERGVRFSGGQRQRIAIARALYRNPEILVLDEATSALDNETEAEVMKSIESLYGTITMIIIAHRLSTVKKCDVVYEIMDGKAIIKEKKELL